MDTKIETHYMTLLWSDLNQSDSYQYSLQQTIMQSYVYRFSQFNRE